MSAGYRKPQNIEQRISNAEVRNFEILLFIIHQSAVPGENNYL